jgi:predicted phage baseplate assembly protein
VTAQDYATLAGRLPGVQRGAAVGRWNGSWHEIHIAVDPSGTEEPSAALLALVRAEAQRYRRIGHDVVVTPPRYVPLLVKLVVCVRPGVIRGHVRAALLAALGSGDLPGGGHGLFHPDNLAFGDAVRLSRVLAAAQAVPGVASVEAVRFERLHGGTGEKSVAPVVAIGPTEIARLDNDPARPDNGRLELDLRGGR